MGVGSGAVVVYNATGLGAIAATTAESGSFELVGITCHFSAAPTTSENLVVTLNASDGAAYDTVLLTINPSTYLSGVTDISWKPDARFIFEAGDQVQVSYPNTDARTYGLRITVVQ